MLLACLNIGRLTIVKLCKCSFGAYIGPGSLFSAGYVSKQNCWIYVVVFVGIEVTSFSVGIKALDTFTTQSLLVFDIFQLNFT